MFSSSLKIWPREYPRFSDFSNFGRAGARGIQTFQISAARAPAVSGVKKYARAQSILVTRAGAPAQTRAPARARGPRAGQPRSCVFGLRADRVLRDQFEIA